MFARHFRFLRTFNRFLFMNVTLFPRQSLFGVQNVKGISKYNLSSVDATATRTEIFNDNLHNSYCLQVSLQE